MLGGAGLPRGVAGCGSAARGLCRTLRLRVGGGEQQRAPHQIWDKAFSSHPKVMGVMLAGPVTYLPLHAPCRLCVWASAALSPTSMSPAGRGASSCIHRAAVRASGMVGAQQILEESLLSSATAVAWRRGGPLFPQAPGVGPEGGGHTGDKASRARSEGRLTPAQYVTACRPLQPGPPAPECPALTSRAGDRHSSTSRLPRPSPLSVSLLCGRGLCRPCQLSSRTWMLVVPGRGPQALSRAWSIHIQPARTGTGLLRVALSVPPHRVPGVEKALRCPALPAWGPHHPLPGLWLTPPDWAGYPPCIPSEPT